MSYSNALKIIDQGIERSLVYLDKLNIKISNGCIGEPFPGFLDKERSNVIAEIKQKRLFKQQIIKEKNDLG